MPSNLLSGLGAPSQSKNPYNHIRRGPNFSRTSLAANGTSPVSIPTTHKVLLQPVIKSKGFNGSSERFPSPKAGEGPGPGVYDWTKGGGFRKKETSPNVSRLTSIKDGGVQHSQSGIVVNTGITGAKPNGYLFTVPNSSSLSNMKKRRVAGQYVSHTGPGPGSYDLPGAFATTSKLASAISKPQSGGIKNIRSNSQGVIRVRYDNFVGPGDYEVHLPGKKTNSGVAMRSKANRFEWESPTEPANDNSGILGNQHIGMGPDGLLPPWNKSAQKYGMNYTSSFAVPIKESLKKVRLEDYDRIKKLLEVEAGAKQKPELWHQNVIPGPGAYETPDSLYWTLNKPANKKGGTVSFLAKNRRSSEQQANSESAPFYDLRSEFDVKKYPGIGMSSMFRSSTKRDGKTKVVTDRFAPVETPFSSDKFAQPNKNPKHLWI